MRALALLTTLFVFGFTPSAASSDAWFSEFGDTVVLRAWFESDNMLQALANRNAPWLVNRERGYAIVEASAFEAEELRKLGLRLELDRRRTERAYALPRSSFAQGGGIQGFACYRTVDETFADAQQLSVDYPTLAAWIDIGDSWEKTIGVGGYDLQVLKITNQAITGDKPKIFVMSAVHARELTTAELTMRFGEYLLENYATDADARWLVDHHEIHLSVQSNPDGRLQAEGLFPWRKNTNQNYCGAMSNQRGADLNRNFAFNWGCCGGSSTDECSGIFRGPTAASEPETLALQNYVRGLFDDQRGEDITDPAPLDAQGVFLDVHSFSRLVLYPWGFTNQGAPNEAQLRTMARKLAFFNDYNPIPITGLTIADGSTVDFAYGELGVAAFAFELGTNFFEDCADFEQTVFPDNLTALIYAAKTARAPYQLPSGPDVTDLFADRNTVLAGDDATLTATVSDQRFSLNAGVEPEQPIAGVDTYLNTPPWQPGAVAVPAQATDGSFDSVTETVSSTVSLSALPVGEHTVFVQARDTAGDTGVVSARFLYVLDPANAGTFSGQVTGADSGQGIAAQVVAGTSQTQSDPVTGAFTLLVSPGVYDIVATPLTDDYEVGSLSGVMVSAGATVTADLSLLPFCAVFEDDAETDLVAWTAEGDWGRSDESSNSPSFAWTDSPFDRYENNQNVSLTSPVIDLSAATQATLEFAQRCDTQPFADFCIVELTTDGSTWTELERYDGFTADPSVFSAQSLDLSSAVGSSSVQVRFRLQTDASVITDGWYLDDIRVRASGAVCLANADGDGDGIANAKDNCTLISNGSQLDTDADGFGNACDADFNNDNITNFLDIARFSQDFLATGNLVTDINGDGIVNFIDLITVRDFFLLPPGPSGVVAP